MGSTRVMSPAGLTGAESCWPSTRAAGHWRVLDDALAGPSMLATSRQRARASNQSAENSVAAGNAIRMEDSALSNTLERNRARTYFQAYAAAMALHFVEKALAEVHAGRLKTSVSFQVPDGELIGCGFHEAVRGVLSHHVVIRNKKIANYHPYPPTCWNASPRDADGTPGPYEDAVQNTPIFEENGPDKFKGIDIMRTVRSFDPCLPCGVQCLGRWQSDRGCTRRRSDASDRLRLSGCRKIMRNARRPNVARRSASWFGCRRNGTGALALTTRASATGR